MPHKLVWPLVCFRLTMRWSILCVTSVASFGCTRRTTPPLRRRRWHSRLLFGLAASILDLRLSWFIRIIVRYSFSKRWPIITRSCYGGNLSYNSSIWLSGIVQVVPIFFRTFLVVRAKLCLVVRLRRVVIAVPCFVRVTVMNVHFFRYAYANSYFEFSCIVFDAFVALFCGVFSFASVF